MIAKSTRNMVSIGGCQSSKSAMNREIREQLKLPEARNAGERANWYRLIGRKILKRGCGADLINPPHRFKRIVSTGTYNYTCPVNDAGGQTKQNDPRSRCSARIILNWYEVELTWLIFTSGAFERTVAACIGIRTN